MTDNVTTTNSDGAHPAEVQADAPPAPVALAAPLALAALMPTPAPAAPAVPAAPPVTPVSGAVYDHAALQKATAKAARRAKAKANRKAQAKAQVLAQARKDKDQALAQARKDKAAKPSPKVLASGLGGAVALLFWTVATATFWKNTFSADTLAALIGATTTIVAAAAAYFKADQLRSGNAGLLPPEN